MVRTRIAPSPTGADIHIGNLYTALINWTYARKNNGKFVIRIEDTDRSRYVPKAEVQIIHTLERFGVTSDEPITKQSESLSIYKEHAEKLVKSGHAYYCFCTPQRLHELRLQQQAEKQQPKYDRNCYKMSQEKIQALLEAKTPYVIRLKIPNGITTFTDVIRGTISIPNETLDDQVLLKSDGFPTYHLGVVVDDHRMKISHIIRAEEWIPSSTPKHVLLYQAFGWELPLFAHVPILRNPDKSKLSKRKNPVWSSWYLDEGYLPEAVLNFLALMGWSHPQQKEIFSLSEFRQVFDITDMQPVGPVFDLQKLAWMNGEYIRKMSPHTLVEKITTFFKGTYSQGIINSTVPLVQERIKTLKEYDSYCRFFIEKPTHFEVDMSKHKETLEHIRSALGSISSWTSVDIKTAMESCAQALGMKNKDFFMILRIAITGKKITPPLNESMEILGKAECVARITAAVREPQLS